MLNILSSKQTRRFCFIWKNEHYVTRHTKYRYEHILHTSCTIDCLLRQASGTPKIGSSTVFFIWLVRIVTRRSNLRKTSPNTTWTPLLYSKTLWSYMSINQCFRWSSHQTGRKCASYLQKMKEKKKKRKSPFVSRHRVP